MTYYLVEEYYQGSGRLNMASAVEANAAPDLRNDLYVVTECKDQRDAERKLAASYKAAEWDEHDIAHSTNNADRNCKYCQEAGWED